MNFFHTIWTFLLRLRTDINDAAMMEFAVLNGNSFERYSLVEGHDKQCDVKPAEKLQRAYRPNDKTATMPSAVPEATQKKKRISDISQLRLDAYVARAEEQAAKQQEPKKA